MRSRGLAYLEKKLSSDKLRPVLGQLALTYRCDYDCLHCYCKGSENAGQELSTSQLKRILDEIRAAGCFWLTLTGGDPLIRPDFREIYLHAKRKGFVITVLTNGLRLNRDLTGFFTRYPPASIDITVNSLHQSSYALITGAGLTALRRVRKNIEYAVRQGVSIVIKANCLKENKNQIHRIKRWASTLLPECSSEKRANFRYDPIIYPRLNGDTEPCRHRLSEREIQQIRQIDPQIKKDHQRYLKRGFPKVKIPHRFLYFCNMYKEQFFIDPFGRLKFCENTHQFCVDLTRISFEQGFYREIPKLARQPFRTNSPCQRCQLRPLCYSCPAAAYLENGQEEQPVAYFCELAHAAARDSSPPVFCHR